MKPRSITVLAGLAIFMANATLAAEPGQAYRVRKGDGLDAIARKHHTNRATLLRLNPLLAPDSLDVGAVIHVPGSKAHATRRITRSLRPAVSKSTPVRRLSASPKPKPPVHKVAMVALKSATIAKPKPIVRLAANKPAAPAPKPNVATPKPAKKPVTAPVAVPRTAATAKPFLPDYKEPKKDENELPLGRVIVDLIWKLALVLGIAYLSIYALRGIMGRQTTITGQKGRLKVLESAALGPNRAVHLVRVGNKILVLGSTPDQITAIGEVDEPEAAQAPAPVPQAFAGHLAEAVAGEKGGALPEQFHGGIKHIWDRVQEIRGLHAKGPIA